MKKIYDGIVIGAGPSGLSTAIQLAKEGWRVAVVERLGFPRDKVCGGFIGYENKTLLEELGVWNTVIEKGAILKEVFLSAGNGCHVSLMNREEMMGIGLSRSAFDPILANRAREIGVDLIDNATHTIQEEGCMKICAVKHIPTGSVVELETRHFVHANGINKKMLPKRKHFGAYALFRNLCDMKGDVALYFVEGGHLGMNCFEDGLVNACYVVEEQLFKKYKGNLEKIFMHFLEEHSLLSRQLSQAQKVKSFKGVSFGKMQSFQFMDGTSYLVGDRVGAINPVVGGGNTLALASGILLTNEMLRFKPNALDRHVVARRYEKHWRAAFARRIQYSWFWGYLSHKKKIVRWIINDFQLQKALLSSVYNNYHKQLKIKFI